MLTFTTAKKIFFICLALLLGTTLFYSLSICWFVLLTGIYGCFIAYGSSLIHSGFFIQTLNCGSTENKHISLTFDDGPHPEYTPLLLEVLAKYKIKACFFCIGNKIEKYPSIVKRIFDEGHIIANHTYSHHLLIDLFPVKKIKDELMKTQFLIEKAIGKKVTLFRPPYGVTNPAISEAVKALKYKTIGWNVRSLDTVIKKNDQLVLRIVKKIKPGSIVLLHDTNHQIVELVSKLIACTTENGIAIVPLDSLLNIAWYE